MIFFLVVSSTDIYISSLPLITRDFGVSPNISSLTLNGFAFGLAIFSLFAGILSERFGSRNIILAGMTIYIFSCIMIFTSISIWEFIFFRIVQSLGAALIVIVSRLIIKDSMNVQDQISANGVILLGLTVSPAISPIIGSLLAHYFGWRACFLTSAILGLIMIVDSIRFLKDVKPHGIKHLPGPITYFKSYFSLFHSSILTPTLITQAAAYASYFSFIGISSFIYINELGMTPIAYSWIFITIAAAFFAGNSYMRILNKKGKSITEIVYTGVLCSIIGAVILFLSYLSTSLFYIGTILTLGVLFMRAGIALINPPIQVMILNHYGKKGGQALGLSTFAQFLGGGIGIAIVTLFHQSPILGLQITSIGFATICLIAFFKFKKCINKI